MARALFDALEEKRWNDAAALFDPAVVEEWHRREITNWRESPEPSSATAIRELYPDAPPEVVAYLVEQEDRALEGLREHIAERFPGVESAEQLAALSPVEALAHALRAEDPSYMIPFDSRSEHIVIGAIPEGEETVHVLYRPDSQGSRVPSGAQTLTLVRRDVRWRVVSGIAPLSSQLFAFYSIGVRRAAEISPVVVAGRFLDAMNAEDWPTAAALFDEVALAWWHRDAVESIEELRDNPLAAGMGPIVLRRHGVESIDELRLIPPREAAERVMAGMFSAAGRRAIIEEVMGMMGTPVEEEDVQEVPVAEFSLVGVARSDQRSAYAVFLERTAATGEGPPRVLVLRRSRDGWRVVPQSLLGGKRDHPQDELPPPVGPK